jgi:DNA mismatch repair ATPase MutL
VGQLRDSYIVLESTDGLYYIDQHALAERIAFEKMKKAAQPKIKKYPPSFNEDAKLLQSEILLQPITVAIHAIANIQEKIDEINLL